MNSLVKVFSNFKEFYSEINGATLTGAIDVIVVEQPDGEFQCSPFHVRFGKLGVLRSREKVVDIEINGEPVDIHMKLGDSGEAFFVEECPEDDVEELPDNLATSPLPTSYFPNKFDDDEKVTIDVDDEKIKNHGHDELLPVSLVLPRRNSIDFSKETLRCEDESNFENQVSDYSHRRHTDNTLERRNLNEKLKEYTTQKIRQKWAEHEEIFQFDAGDQDKEWQESTNIEEEEKPPQNDVDIVSNDYSRALIGNIDCQEEENIVENKDEMRNTDPVAAAVAVAASTAAAAAMKMENATEAATNAMKEESKSKKKRRKKSQMKKKNAQRKSSSSSSVGSNATAEMSSSNIVVNATGGGNIAVATIAGDDCDTMSMINHNNNNNNNNRNSSNDELMQTMTTVMVGGGGGGDDVGGPLSSSTLVNVDATTSVIATTATATATATTTTTTTTAIYEINNHSSELVSPPPVTPSTTRIPDLDIHFFSDTEVTSSGGNGSCGLGLGRGTVRPSTPVQSDSELEISLRGKDADVDLLTTSASWKWGELPTPDHHTIDQETTAGGQMAAAQAQRNSMLSGMFNFMKKTNKMRKRATEGLYLSELDASSMDPEMAALYFPPANVSLTKAKAHANATQQTTTTMTTTTTTTNDDDRESGNGTSLPHSPSSMECQKSIDSDYEDGGGGSGVGGSKSSDAKYLDFVAMSLCGLTEKGEPSDEQFDRHIIKYSDVCENPTLFASPNLVVRLNGKYYSWAAACPIVMTIITFQKPLTNDAVEQIISDAKQDAAAAVAAAGKNEMDGNLSIESVDRSQAKRSWWYWRRPQGGNATDVKVTKDINKLDNKLTEVDGVDQAAAVATQTTRPNSPDASDNTLSKTDSTTLNAENTSAMVENLADLSASSMNSQKSPKNERYKKTLRLSSEAIKKLNLKDGSNEIEFSVTTAYQGTTRCKCCLFRWKYSDKVVISDIDGTITKSDVLGHLLPMVGKDWAQLGVAQLFSKIEQNGYKLLYLSARAIGQSRATREYLRSIRQGDVKLPDGPLLLNPTSLISAFHREVIERKPEQFKIACLSDIRDLFPDKQPFYAGYGNRINDVWAYRAVGIPIMRIFTINTKGELKHELTQTFQSSYCSMTYIVDQLFPPINVDEGSIEFSSFNYWREPILELNLDADGVELPPPPPPPSPPSTTTTRTAAAAAAATTTAATTTVIILPTTTMTAAATTTTTTIPSSGDDVEVKTLDTNSPPIKFPVIAKEKN